MTVTGSDHRIALERALSRLLTGQPEALRANPDRVEGLLRDEVPRAAREIAAVAAAQRAGITFRSAEEVLKVLREDTPVSDELAAWAVGVWQRAGGAAAVPERGHERGQEQGHGHGAAREAWVGEGTAQRWVCLLYTSPSPRDRTRSRMPSSA